MLVDLVEKEYSIGIRKNYTPELSNLTQNKETLVSTCEFLGINKTGIL